MAEFSIRLSIIVRIVGGSAFLRQCLSALVPQTKGRPIEILVPYDSTINGVQHLAADFPEVIFVDSEAFSGEKPQSPAPSPHQLYDRRTAEGLRIARGEILALLEDFGVPDPDWCREIIEAHRLSYGVIGGAVEHAGTALLNWGVYFLDFARYQLPLREGPTDYLTDVNVSYKRPVLESVRVLWEERYNEVTVHWGLSLKGVTLWQRPQIIVREDRGALSFRQVLRERYEWGRVFGFMRMREISAWPRLLYIAASPLIPAIMLWRIARKVFGSGRNRVPLLLALPILAVLACAWSAGELAAYVTGTEVYGRAADPHRPKVKGSWAKSNADWR